MGSEPFTDHNGRVARLISFFGVAQTHQFAAPTGHPGQADAKQGQCASTIRNTVRRYGDMCEVNLDFAAFIIAVTAATKRGVQTDGAVQRKTTVEKRGVIKIGLQVGSVGSIPSRLGNSDQAIGHRVDRIQIQSQIPRFGVSVQNL